LHYDGAGAAQSVSFDFKGNLLESQRRLATEYHSQVDWSALATITTVADIVAAAEDLLEDEVFPSHTAYDALNRPVSMTTPDSSEIRPGYNEAGLLERVDVRVRDAADWTVFVKNIDYDAKGQRMAIAYGDDGSGGGTVTTEYTYDPLTFRMTQLKSTRASDDAVLQNLAYTYDPVGNITEIKDSAQQTVFFGGDVIVPRMAYVYDALYRLTQAKGREQAGMNADVQRDQDDVPLLNLPDPNDTNAVRSYTEDYVYDAVGNLLSMSHDSGSAPTSWTRHYDIATTSNRLLGTSAPLDDEGEFSATYGYDDHGNMTSMPHLETIGWDYRDEMVSADKGSGSGTVYFTYDATGQRARKVYEHSGLIEERIYLGGFEIYRKRVASSGELVLERETLHVMDGVQRVALVETKTVDTSIPAYTPATVVRLQMGNHLGSVALEVDLGGLVISYEEYHPYGTTAYQSSSGAAEVSLKRYRYTGKERDEETGLYYHGARYYAPWLGRWTAADPTGVRGGINLYGYAAQNPVKLVDPNGHEPTTTYLGSSKETAYEARLQKVWGGNQYWSDTGSNGAGWYVRTEGQRILPGPVTPAGALVLAGPSGPSPSFLDWDPSKGPSAPKDSDQVMAERTRIALSEYPPDCRDFSCVYRDTLPPYDPSIALVPGDSYERLSPTDDGRPRRYGETAGITDRMRWNTTVWGYSVVTDGVFKDSTPMSKELINHYMDGTGSPYVLSRATVLKAIGEGAQGGTSVDEGPLFAEFKAQLSKARAGLKPGEKADVPISLHGGGFLSPGLGRSGVTISGVAHVSKGGGTDLSDVTMVFDDWWNFDPSWIKPGRGETAEHATRQAWKDLPGLPFKATTDPLPVEMGSRGVYVKQPAP
jgi:RHS repeat-associated protein